MANDTTDWIVQRIKTALTVQPISSYMEHGCNIHPRGKILVRVDYWEAVDDLHPSAGRFGGCAFDEGIAAARLLFKETYPDSPIETVLAIPTLVCRIG